MNLILSYSLPREFGGVSCWRLEIELTYQTTTPMSNPQNLEPSDLRSIVSTLADLVTIQQQEAELDRADNNRRFEESRQQADRDRALMLQLIQAIAQGRNGG